MNLIRTEFNKILSEIKYYYPDYIVHFIVDIFILIFIINTSDDINSNFFGYVSWILASGVLSEASLFISLEKQMGTLQNLMIKPYSILQIAVAKTIVWFIMNSVKISIIAIALKIFYYPNLIFDARLVMAIIVVSAGMLGVSLIMAALTLMFTKVASFETIISYLMLYLSGSIFTVPKALIYTNPLSTGTHLARKIINNTSTSIDYLNLFIVSGVWFIAGYAFFKYLFKRSKDFKWTY